MDTAIKKSKLTRYLVLSALLLVIAVVAVLYFLVWSKEEEKPLRGTYVISEHCEVTQI
jgi:hypothetical protein